MQSLRTVFRAIVMIVTGVIVAKGWQLYGPSNERVKDFTAAALEKALAAWDGSAVATSNVPKVVESGNTQPPSMGNAVQTVPLPAEPAPQLVPLPKATAEPPVAATGTPATIAAAPSTAMGEDEVASLLTQLQQMGAIDAQVVQWGSSGQLYRCFCRAKVADTAPTARHFEAVAPEPTTAVEQVVAKVEAWRTEQQSLLR